MEFAELFVFWSFVRNVSMAVELSVPVICFAARYVLFSEVILC